MITVTSDSVFTIIQQDEYEDGILYRSIIRNVTPILVTRCDVLTKSLYGLMQNPIRFTTLPSGSHIAHHRRVLRILYESTVKYKEILKSIDSIQYTALSNGNMQNNSHLFIVN